MKTDSFFSATLAALLLTFAGTTVQARSWRIHSDASKKAHFTDINAAMSSSEVAAGDTLYLDPGCEISTDQTISKRVTIIGRGLTGSIPVSWINTNVKGKTYITASGVSIQSAYLHGITYIRASNVTIERCWVYGIASDSGTAQNVIIRQCDLSNNGEGSTIKGRGTSSSYTSDWTIENCVIKSLYSYCISELYKATIRNNLIINTFSSTNNVATYCLRNLNSGVLTNNIMIQTRYPNNVIYSTTCSTCTFSHNIISQNYEASDNIVGITSTDAIFTGEYTSYELIENSPAAGYGTDGTDCGIFGGKYHYVSSGYPLGLPYLEINEIPNRLQDGHFRITQKVKVEAE